ncbi:MAG TPA: homoserine O-acetyltransferase [Sporichthya sp.]|nr:homoserine O-acetyltransferase [Sporichthya sp.]
MPAEGSTVRPGGWREGDPVADRRFAELGPLSLELGGALPAVTLAYETWGTLDADAANGVLVLHALTGDAHVHGVAGPGQPTPGWWDGLIGPGRPLDTDRVYVVAANVLGGCQGSSGPSSLAPDGAPLGSRFPRITIADQVACERLLADRLGIRRWVAVLGGSMGGMRALEWAYAHPDRVGAALVVAVGASATGDQIGTQSTQITAITADPGWAGGDYYDDLDQGPWTGMEIARRIAHLTYRSEYELQERFAGTAQEGEDPFAATAPGRFAVQSYLDYQAAKLTRRFDPGTYVALTDAMNTWDLGRGRGGVPAALARIEVPLVVGGVDSDRLYPLWQQEQIATAPGTVKGLRVITSLYGHDGFLIERDAIFALAAEAVAVGLEHRT